MCGRYRRTTQEEELARLYHIPIPKQTDLPISYNIAPSQQVLTIRFNPETQQRSLDALQWGLIPSWANDPKIGYKTVNARVETIDTAPSFREAFKKRRCLIPADGFYEWQKVVGGKIPFSIGMKDDAPFVFEALGRLERSRDSGLVAHLHHHHRRAQRARRQDPQPDACDSR
jgi:putative SOS response-associated peptidase YedK